MKRSTALMVGVTALFLFVGCLTMYEIAIVNDENQRQNISVQYPNYVNMLVRVTDGRVTTQDASGKVIPDFSNPDYYVVGLTANGTANSAGNFTVLENDIEVKVEAGLRVVPLEELELHLNLLVDVSGSIGTVGLIQAKNAIKHLIARPSTSAEISTNDPKNFSYTYEDWDSSTKTIVEKTEIWRSILKDNQIVSIYTFADKVRKLKLRELDGKGNRYPDKTRQLLDTIDQSITLGVDSTNLYGALLAGLEDLRSVRSLSDPHRGFVDGVVVAFTDGSHTAGNIQHNGQTYTPAQAIEKIHQLRGDLTDLQSLRVINIAVKSPELLEAIPKGPLAGGGLKDIQNAGFLRVDDYSGLEDRFVEAFKLIDRYTKSLYWIYYRSPKIGYQNVEIKLQVHCDTCQKGPDGAVPEYASILESVNTNGFYQVLPGVYINDPIVDENGRVADLPDNNGNNRAHFGEERIEVRSDPKKLENRSRIIPLILANNPNQRVNNQANTQLLTLHTYVRANDNRFKPQYQIHSSDPSVVKVIGYVSLTAIESLVLIECLLPGRAGIEVLDTANGNLKKTITIDSRIDQPQAVSTVSPLPRN